MENKEKKDENEIKEAKKNRIIEEIKKWIFFNLGIMIILLLLWCIMLISDNKLATCFMKQFFNSFCPFCGGTRCTYNIFKLNFVEAFKYHPTTVFLFFYVVLAELVYIYNIFAKKKIRTFLYEKVHIAVYVYIGATLIQYVIRLYYFYNNIECPFMYIDI